MLRRTTLAAAVLVPACALALSACSSQGAGSASAGASTSAADQGGGQNNAHLTQTQLLDRLKTALASATALHIKGSLSEGGSGASMALNIDLQLNKGGTGQGTITEGTLTMPVIRMGSTTYIQATASYVQQLKSSAAGNAAVVSFLAQATAGKWLKYTGNAASTAGFGSLTDFSQTTQQLASGAQDTFTYTGTGTADGQQVAQYKDHSTSSSSPDAVMSIPLTGSPLPLQEDAGSQGTMSFVWNQPTTVSAPPSGEVLTVPAALLGSS